MSSLSDLFSVNTFVLLAIVVGAVAFVFVYFEGKLREQNQKVQAMFSIVSTLAEETQAIKNHIGHSFDPASMVAVPQPKQTHQVAGAASGIELIEVSDGDADSEDDSCDSHSESDSDSDSDSEVDCEELQDDDEDGLQLTQVDTLEDLVDDDEAILLDNTIEELEPEIMDDFEMEELPTEEEVLPTEEEEAGETHPDIKVVVADLGEKVDYHAMQLPKLRQVVLEKNLCTASEAKTLKKPELLKLLQNEK